MRCVMPFVSTVFLGVSVHNLIHPLNEAKKVKERKKKTLDKRYLHH